MNRLAPSLYDFLARLLGLGIAAPSTLELAAEEFGDPSIAGPLKASSEAVRNGESIADSIAPHADLFPPLAVELIRVGEAGGQLEAILRLLSDRYLRTGGVPDALKDRMDLFFDLLPLELKPREWVTLLAAGSIDPEDEKRAGEILPALSIRPNRALLAELLPGDVESYLDAVGGPPLTADIARRLAGYLRRRPEGALRRSVFFWGASLATQLPAAKMFGFLSRIAERSDLRECFEALANPSTGDSWSNIMKRYPGLFGPALVAVVRDAEIHGNMEKTLRRVEEGMDRGQFLPRDPE